MSNWRSLKGKNIYFEPLNVSIVESLHAYMSDEEVSKYIGWPLTQNLDETKAYFEKLIANEAANTHEYASIVLNGEHIGTMMLFNIAQNAKNLEVGYVLSKEHWGKGYGFEALELIKDYIINETDFHKICARVVGCNFGSSRILEKAGFLLEGQLIDQYFIEKTYYDAMYYGLIINRC